MAIGARCPACGKDYHLADEQAGQRVRCRVCRAEFDVAGRVETLEAVPREAMAGQPGPPPPSPLYESLEAAPPPRKRRWRYVLAALALLLLLTFMSCCGTGWFLVGQKNQDVDLLRRQFNAGMAAAREEAKSAKEKADDDNARARKADRERVEAELKLAASERRIANLEQEMKGVQRAVMGLEDLKKALARLSIDDLAKLLGDLKLGEADLKKLLEGLKVVRDIPTADLSQIKDLDDALARLKSKNSGTKLKGLQWIQNHKPPFAGQDKRRVLDALEPLTGDDDVFVKKAAIEAQLLVELDL